MRGAGDLPYFSELSVRTSMRNQLPCQVHSLQASGHIVRVTLVPSMGASADAVVYAPAQAQLVSRITRESSQLLALQPGLTVLALCKATAVTVQRAVRSKGLPAAAGNVLAGRAIRVSRGETGDEVSLRVDAGQQWVGFAPSASGIRVGSRVVAQVDESALVVALPG